MAIDDHEFRNALGCFPSGITVVTTVAEDGSPHGVTVTAFSSVSLNPPLVLISLNRKTSDLDAYCSGHFAVNVLRDNQKQLSISFAARSSNKWATTKYDVWEGKSPILSGCIANIECQVETVHEAGDHFIIIGRVIRLASIQSGEPLLYFRSAYAGLGSTL